MFPRHGESSVASKNYLREMTGMFKVNKMGVGEDAKECKQVFFFGGGSLTHAILFAIICCLGNWQLFFAF